MGMGYKNMNKKQCMSLVIEFNMHKETVKFYKTTCLYLKYCYSIVSNVKVEKKIWKNNCKNM